MQQILVLGGGASGLAAALAAARAGARVTVLERNAKPGKKLLATGNGRCNLDNTGITPELYFTSDPAGLKPLLAAVNAADPLGWFESLGLYTRTDEAGRVYPYSNQAADVLALLEHHLEKYNVRIRCGCTVRSLSQSRGGYAVQFVNAEASAREPADGRRHLCHGRRGRRAPVWHRRLWHHLCRPVRRKAGPLYPCLTALQIAKPQKALAGIRAKATASLLDGKTLLAAETGEVQFTDYGLSGICIMQLSGLLAPGRGLKQPAVELDLFPRAGRSGPCRPVCGPPAPPCRGQPGGILAGPCPPQAGPGPLGGGTAAGNVPPRPAPAGMADAGPHGQTLAVRRPDPLRLEAGPDHRRRPLPQRNGRAVPVPGLPGPLLCGRNAGLCRQLRRVQPPLGFWQRPGGRAQCGKACPAPKALKPQKETLIPQKGVRSWQTPFVLLFFIRWLHARPESPALPVLPLPVPAGLPRQLPPPRLSGTRQKPTTWAGYLSHSPCGRDNFS